MREMKESGIDWIGQIPKEWSFVRAKNIFTNHKDIVGQKESEYERLALTLNGVLKRSKDDIKGLQSESLSTYQILNEKELVFKMIDLANVNTSRVGYSPYTGIVSPVYIIFHNDKYTKFGYYYFYSMWQREIFNNLGNDGVRSALNAIDMLNLPFPGISIEEANKIAGFLDKKIIEIDKVIEKTKETIEDYKKYKQSIISEEVTKGRNLNVKMKKINIEYINQIPQHWKIVPLKTIFNFIGGYAYKSEKFCNETDNQVIRLGNIKNDYFILNDKQIFIDEEYALESKKCRIMENDILFTMTGTKGKKDYFYTLIVKLEHIKNKKLFLNQRVGCFRAKDNSISMAYFNYLLKYEPLKDYIFLFETGTANQGNLGIETISTLKLLLPPKAEQEAIVDYLDKKCVEIDKLIKNKEIIIEELEQYKRSLIYEYVTGKKEVV